MRSTNIFSEINCKSNIRPFNISSVVLRLWNKLPNQIKGTLTYALLILILKQCFKSIVLMNCFYWIDLSVCTCWQYNIITIIWCIIIAFHKYLYLVSTSRSCIIISIVLHIIEACFMYILWYQLPCTSVSLL